MSDNRGPAAKRPRADTNSGQDDYGAESGIESQESAGVPMSDYDKMNERMERATGVSSGGGGGRFKLNQAWTGTVYLEGSGDVTINSFDLYAAACQQHPILKPQNDPKALACLDFIMQVHGYTMEGADNNTIIMDQPNFMPRGAQDKPIPIGSSTVAPAGAFSNVDGQVPVIQPRRTEFVYPVIGQSNAKLAFSWPNSLELYGAMLDSNTGGRGIVNFQSQAIDPSTVTVDKFYAKLFISVKYNNKFTLSTIIPTTRISNIKAYTQLMQETKGDKHAATTKFWEDIVRRDQSDRERIIKVGQMRALGHDLPKSLF